MKTDDVVMRSDDVRGDPLQQSGWTVVARSWGARLDATLVKRVALQQYQGSAATDSTVRELTQADAPDVLELDAATLGDYPGGVATRHEPLVAARAVPSPTRRAFGAFSPDCALIAMTWIDINGTTADIDFTVVRPPERGQGHGTAVKAASILALLEAGIQQFRTGGSSENAGSIATNQKLGFVLEEEWITLSPPRQKS